MTDARPALLASRSGTLGRILNDGSDGKPWQATVHGRRRVFILTSAVALDAQPGDEITAFGSWTPGEKKPANGTLSITDPNPAIYRLTRQIGPGAEIRHYGAGDRPRPGAIAAAAAAGTPLVETPGRQGITILEPAEQSPDPIVAWAAGRFKGLARRGSIHIIDPLAFIRPKRQGKVDLHAAWRSVLPQASSTRFAKIFAARGGKQGGVAWPFAKYSALAYQTGFVIPWNPFDSVETGLVKYAGLSAMPYLVPPHDDAGFKRSFTLAHELAHIVQRDQGLGRTRHPSRIRQREIYADSFATLAVAQKTGRFDLLETVRDAREVSMLTTGMDHWTGPGFTEAIAVARRLHDEGRLATLTTQEMLTIASGIAKRHWMTLADMEDMRKRRDRVLTAAGYRCVDGRVGDPGGRRDLSAVVRAAQADPAKPLGKHDRFFAESAAALDRVAIPLNKPRTAEQQAGILAALKADMDSCTALLSHSPEGLNRLLASERKRTAKRLKAALVNGNSPSLWQARAAVIEAAGTAARAARPSDPNRDQAIEPLVTIRRDPQPLPRRRA